MEQVNHPQHYNQHPAGVECIDVIRHYAFDIGCAIKYLWRAGLKKEPGKEDADKEMEDLAKAIWYINDFLTKETSFTRTEKIPDMCRIFRKMTGYPMRRVTAPYNANIARALKCLFSVGFQWYGAVWVSQDWQAKLRAAAAFIQKRIMEISKESN